MKLKKTDRKVLFPSFFFHTRSVTYIQNNNTECNITRYTSRIWGSHGGEYEDGTILKIYCDQMNSNMTTQFLTETLLTLQDFLQLFNMAATGYAADIQTIF
jgi:hypothetical protein